MFAWNHVEILILSLNLSTYLDRRQTTLKNNNSSTFSYSLKNMNPKRSIKSVITIIVINISISLGRWKRQVRSDNNGTLT